MAESEPAKDAPPRRGLEDHPASFLHALRQVQGGTPYRPATWRQVVETTRNGARRYRVAPHVAQRVLQDWYRKVNGFYNINVNPAEVKSGAQAKKRNREETTAAREENPSASGDEPAPATAAPVPPEKSSSSLQAFRTQRLAQILSGGPQPKLCAFFNTREGCRRGDLCPFAHLVM